MTLHDHQLACCIWQYAYLSYNKQCQKVMVSTWLYLSIEIF